MNNPKDGGPAFPMPGVYGPLHGGVPVSTYYNPGGMSLRDWFAAQFAAAQLARGHLTLGMLLQELIINEKSAKDCASIAYQMADAMIAAREVKTP